MIRKEDEYTNTTISVYLLDGKVFENCDVPAQPFGEYERVVYFYYNDKIHIYPMSQIEHIEMSFR